MSVADRALGLVATVATAVAANLALSGTAFAYIDPGTGTMLWQIAAALIAGGLFYLRSARLWVSRRFGFGKNNAEPKVGNDGDSGRTE